MRAPAPPRAQVDWSLVSSWWCRVAAACVRAPDDAAAGWLFGFVQAEAWLWSRRRGGLLLREAGACCCKACVLRNRWFARVSPCRVERERGTAGMTERRVYGWTYAWIYERLCLCVLKKGEFSLLARQKKASPHGSLKWAGPLNVASIFLRFDRLCTSSFYCCCCFSGVYC